MYHILLEQEEGTGAWCHLLRGVIHYWRFCSALLKKLLVFQGTEVLVVLSDIAGVATCTDPKINARTPLAALMFSKLFLLTLTRIRCFATFAHTGGGGVRPPWRFQTKRRRASRKRPADSSRRVLAIGGIIFGLNSIFDLVMAGQLSNFRKFHDFSTSRGDSIKTIYP